MVAFGAGKTLITESMAFALFGSVALRGKASGYDKKLEVELSFNYRNETFIIKRKLNDAILYMLDKIDNEFKEIVNSTSIVNQKIISLLGYNYDIYLLSNYCKQKKLAYFSELTPAKRLQYIDKISGIEESKEYLLYLTSIRKQLRDNISLMKDMVVKPVKPDSVDLDFDYEFNINSINEKLNNVNSLYNEYNKYLELSTITVDKPINPLTEKQNLVLQINKDSFSEVEDWFINVKNKEYNIKVIENKIRDIPRIDKKYDNLTLEIVDHYIHQHNLNIISEIKDNVNLQCPTCNTQFELSSIFNLSSSGSAIDKNSIPIEVLYNIKSYILNEYKNQRLILEKELTVLEQEFESYYDSGYKFNSFKSYSDFVNFYNKAEEQSSLFIQEINLYEQLINEVNKNRTKALKLKNEIDDFLNEQKQLMNLKDEYIKNIGLKNNYLERLDIYNMAINKYTTFKNQLDIVSNLIKDLSEIVHKIKEDTIPLINYYASYYLNLITNGIMTTIEVTDNYDLIVDGHDINLKSGGQQDIASLSYRLALSKSIITGMLPVLVLDEVDSSGAKDSVDDIMNAIDAITNSGYQVVLITHKDISDLEDINVIRL